MKHSSKTKKRKKKTELKVKVKPKKIGFFDSLFGILKEEGHIIEKEINELKENGKIRDKFEEEYKNYIKRKERERKEPEYKKLKKIPTVEEIQKRALPVGIKHEKILVEKKKPVEYWIKTGVPGFDDLLEKGIPKGSAILIAGGPGTGKTIFCLQTLNHAASNGEKCIYISFEEPEERLIQHMKNFGWNPEKLIKNNMLIIKRVDPFKISRAVEAMLAKAKGELLIKIEEIPELIPKNFKPDRIVMDSLTALASAFVGREQSYRVYIEQLFRYFERMGVTSFLISETEQVPILFSKTGVEEFLADGVVVLYNVRRGNIRNMAIEVLKLRGVKHQKKIVAMQILSGKGIKIYSEQEVFGGIEEEKL